MTLEIRTGELRASSPGRLTGYVARFGSETRIGDFFERVMPGAFRASLGRRPQHRGTCRPRPPRPSGSTASGTLELRSDEHGLAFLSFACLTPAWPVILLLWWRAGLSKAAASVSWFRLVETPG